MQLSHVAGRLTRLAVALTVVAVAGLPRPALAAEPYVGLYSYLDAQAITIGTAGKTVPFYFGASAFYGAKLPASVTVKVDVSKPAGVVTAKLAEPTPGCSASGPVFTCTKDPAHRGGPEGDFALVFTAGSAAQVGSSAQVAITLSAPGVETYEYTTELVVTEEGPDLRARDFERDGTPGGTVTFRPEFRNQGDSTAEMLVVSLNGDVYAETTDRFSNCHYGPPSSYPAAVCVFNHLDIAPGETVTTTTDVSVKVGSAVPGWTFAYYTAHVYANDTQIGADWTEWPKGNGPELAWRKGGTSQRSTSDADYLDNQGTVRITTPPNPSDVVAIGDSVTAKVGDTVKVEVGLTNKGPGHINGVSDGEGSDADDPYNAGFVVKFPAGVAVKAMENPPGDGRKCHGVVNGTFDQEPNLPGRSEYRCMAWALGVDASHVVTFTVQVTGDVSTAGSVVARGGSSDPNTTNNTAAVTFTGDGGLPVTGVNVGLAAAAGGLLLAAGFGVFLVARRRRAVFVTD